MDVNKALVILLLDYFFLNKQHLRCKTESVTWAHIPTPRTAASTILVTDWLCASAYLSLEGDHDYIKIFIETLQYSQRYFLFNQQVAIFSIQFNDPLTGDKVDNIS